MKKKLSDEKVSGTTLSADGSDASLDASATDASVGITPPPNSPDPLEGPKWASTTITWSFASSNVAGQPLNSVFSNFITNSAYQLLVEKAVALWSAVSGITMRQVPDSASTDIRIGFEAFSAIDTVGYTAYQYAPKTNQFAAGTTVGLLDPAQDPLSASPDGDYSYTSTNLFVKLIRYFVPSSNFFQDIVHELGHALGLAHNTVDTAAVMNPTLTSENRSIDPNDAAAIEQLYGGTDTASSKVVITDNGPDNYGVSAGGKVNPFAGLAVTDGAGLHEVVTVTVIGGGTLSDPTAGTDANFTGGVFTESGDNLTATDYAQTILRRLVYTAPNPDTKASFNVEVDNSLQGSATNSNVTVTPAPTVTILATFTGTSGTTLGADPKGGLIEDSAGNLYGTTPLGGASNDGNDGTVFEIPKTATGYGTLKTLASFSNNFGEGPPAGLVADSAGDLFGTTYGGGASYGGTVFEIAKGASTPTILASFNAGAASTTTGSGPEAGLVMDSAGDLFGTTTYGGASQIYGALFEIPKSAVGYGPLTLLASFNSTDGAVPTAGLTIDSAGNLLGTTSQGGAYSDGTVFELAKTGGTPTPLVNFNGTDGSRPLAGLITDSAGDLFGTTSGGGLNNLGTVFEIKKTGTTYASTPTTLVSFTSAASYGYAPVGSLIMDAAGDLFGTTSGGGASYAGTVFEIKTANTATGYASAPILVSSDFNFSAYGGTLLADRTTGNLFVPSGNGVGYGSEVEITNSGFVTTAPTATAAAATSPVTTTVTAGSTLSVTSTESIPNLVDDGTVAIASGGSLDVTSAVDPSSSGIFQLAGNASLEIASILGTGLKIQFLGSSPTNELTIDSAANFGTQVGTASYAGPLLESFAAGDVIDLKGIADTNLKLAYTSATGDLQITGSSGSALATLAFQNSTLGAGTFHAASDGVGGTLIMHS